MYSLTLKHPAHNEIAGKEAPCCHLELSLDPRWLIQNFCSNVRSIYSVATHHR